MSENKIRNNSGTIDQIMINTQLNSNDLYYLTK